MFKPFICFGISPTDGEIPKQMKGLNMKLLREKAIALPKLGLKTMEEAHDDTRLSTANRQSLKDIATWLAQEVTAAFKEVTTDAKYPFVNMVLPDLQAKYPGKFHFALGSGTFEGYVGWGYGIAASADGRRKGKL